MRRRRTQRASRAVDGLAGCVQSRIARQTGTRVRVYHAEEAGMDPCDGECRWYTVCEDHGSLVGHRSRRLASWFAASPVEWCEDCREAAVERLTAAGEGGADPVEADAATP